MDKWGSYEFCVSWFGGKPKETLRHSALELFGSGRVFVLTSLPMHDELGDWSDIPQLGRSEVIPKSQVNSPSPNPGSSQSVTHRVC